MCDCFGHNPVSRNHLKRVLPVVVRMFWAFCIILCVAGCVSRLPHPSVGFLDEESADICVSFENVMSEFDSDGNPVLTVVLQNHSDSDVVIVDNDEDMVRQVQRLNLSDTTSGLALAHLLPRWTAGTGSPPLRFRLLRRRQGKLPYGQYSRSLAVALPETNSVYDVTLGFRIGTYDLNDVRWHALERTMRLERRPRGRGAARPRD